MSERDGRSLAPERHTAILRWLDGEGRVISAQVAARLGVSMDTVRRDLGELEASGALRRVHGGAVRPAPGPRRFVDRLADDDPAKEVIAALAVDFVARGQLVALGGGTTTLLLARRLPRDLEATVLTSSPDVALALRDHPAVEVDLLGGRLHRDSQTVTGADALGQLALVRPDVCVISGCGVDPEAGVTVRERDEAQVLRAMLQRSQRAVVLAAAEKLGSAGPYVVAPTASVDVLVSDAPRADLGAYEELGVTVVTPETPVRPALALGA